mgnify:CR=1 FL=1
MIIIDMNQIALASVMMNLNMNKSKEVDENDLIVDPFAGSCTTGSVAEQLNRRWICIDIEEEYLKGGKGRFLKEFSFKTSL